MCAIWRSTARLDRYTRLSGTSRERRHEPTVLHAHPDEPWMPETSGRGLPSSRHGPDQLMAVKLPARAAAGHSPSESVPMKRCPPSRTGLLDTMRNRRDVVPVLDEPDTYALVRHHPPKQSKDAMRTNRALILLCRQALRSIPDTGARDLFAIAAVLRPARSVCPPAPGRHAPARAPERPRPRALREEIFASLLMPSRLLLLPFIGKDAWLPFSSMSPSPGVIRSYFSR